MKIIPPNLYTRQKYLPEFLKNLNPEKLREYGSKQIPKDYMTNYGYNREDEIQTKKHKEKLTAHPFYYKEVINE